MVRNYVAKTKPYAPEDIKLAIDEYFSSLDGTVSIQAVADKYKIPRKTLSDHINAAKNNKDRKVGSGRITVLPLEIEEYLVDGIIQAAEIGWPLNRTDIKSTVREYCIKMKIISPDNDSFPGKDWIINFRRR